MSALTVCPECRRHVRYDEPSCPFCAASTEGADPPRRGAARYLKRAAVVAVGSLTMACTATPAYGEPPDSGTGSADAGLIGADAGPDEIDAGNIAPPYGAPVSTELV